MGDCRAMIERLEKDQEKFKRVFSEFNEGNETKQKRAIQKLKKQGLVSKVLRTKIAEMEYEEEQRRLAALKKPEEDEV